MATPNREVIPIKKVINIFSICGILLAILLMAFIYFSEIQVSPTQMSGKETTAFEDFPQDQARFIDFEIDERALANLTRREQRDQMLDWLLYTAVSAAGLSVEEMNQSLFDLSLVRTGICGLYQILSTV
jgi:hypothetical protein